MLFILNAGRGHDSCANASTPCARTSHVVCIFNRGPPSPRHPHGLPLPVASPEDVGKDIFLEELNDSLHMMGVTELSSYVSHVLPLLEKVLTQYSMQVVGYERKTCQRPVDSCLDAQDYLLLTFQEA